MGKIVVLYPITVPNGKYCWGKQSPLDVFEVCEHFDSEGGHLTCDLGFDVEKFTNEGVLKPKECLKLVKV